MNKHMKRKARHLSLAVIRFSRLEPHIGFYFIINHLNPLSECVNEITKTNMSDKNYALLNCRHDNEHIRDYCNNILKDE